ncbi:hypothetical protein SAMN02745883_00686 [Caminicella sporogenes DSM 14501]|uniref:Uncharacterized protein n=1 Tax=Caminicella sporogenes DSM 14501 TaxID=1121266 RepID=A0A1M6MXF3_9FIRM|nr:hypothetical protein [Caminicella sporogenes]RKD22459.1 hypothetical protein BET04_05350 [Caminicella sporogenes]SHJ88070.1 hypothetical protein SAMN02745883_00686 [Caminicella sporogenes DSM 14501]
MPLTNAGRDEIAAALIGEGIPFNNSNAKIGVGDGDTAFAATQTDLTGTNKFRKGMDTGYPIRDGNTITFRATFGGDEANFAWKEWGVFNAASGGVMLNRVVDNNGTKLQGQTWTFTVTITINAS